jgi:small-conductance mechanosensitive channel
MKEIILQYGISVLIIVATFVLGYIVNRLLTGLIKRSSDDMQNDPTNYKFLRHLIMAMIYLVGFGVAIFSIPSLKAVASSLLAGAGILAVAAGFASQHALSNIISGLFIVIFKPFRINDRLSIQTYMGIVEDITLRHTVIRDFENKRIIIPNTVISDEIIVNADFAEEKVCKWIDIGISYDSDIDLAKKIMFEEISEHPNYLDVRTQEDIDNGVPLVTVRVLALQDSAVLLRGWAWAMDAPSSFIMGCDLFESIKKRFDKEGVEIPFPQRTVWVKEGKSVAK